MSISSLQFQKVSFSHGPQELILESADFEFPLGQIVWVQAKGGTGRSTVLQLLAVLTPPTSGCIYINQKNVTAMSFEEFLPYRLQIGYGFDFGGLINNRTIFENLLLPLQYHKLTSYDQAVKQVQDDIDHFELERYAELRPALVPGGVRKLVCILRSLTLFPDLLVLDDPSVGLSHDIASRFVDRLIRLRSQGFCRSVYFSTYDEKFANQLPHVTLLLDDGKITKTSSPIGGAA